MARKKNNKHLIAGTLPRYISNFTIENFAKGQKAFNDNVFRVCDILHREGCDKAYLFSTEKALDLDAVERENSLAQRCRTVDMVVGCDNNTLLMVEAKFRVKIYSNIRGKSLSEKRRFSWNLLHCNDEYSIWPSVVVLLPHQQFERKKNEFMRTVSNSPSFIPLTIEDFKRLVF